MKPSISALARHRNAKRRAVTAFAVAAFVAVGAGAWTYIASKRGAPHEATAGTLVPVSTLLQTLEVEDAGWNVDVLSAGLGLEENYDEIAARKRRIDDNFAVLGARGASDPVIRSHVEVLRKIFDEKSDDVETFKSHHSILRNSLRYVSAAADEARNQLDGDSRADPKARDVLRGALDAASSNALRYAIVDDDDQRARLAAATRALDEAVARVPDASPAKAQLLIVLNHLQTVLHQKADVDALLRAILGVPTRKVVEDAQARIAQAQQPGRTP